MGKLMFKLSIGQKILSGFFILIVLSASFVFISFSSLSKINILSSMVLPLSREINILQNYIQKIKQLETKTDLYLTIRSEGSREELITLVKETNSFINEISQVENAKPLKDISSLILQLNNSIETLVGYIDNHESAYKINLQMVETNKLFEGFHKMQEALQQQRLKHLEMITNEEKSITEKLLGIFMFIEVSIILVGFLASFILTRLITNNLSKLHKGTQEIAAGNFGTRINITSRDEIGQLADSFNLMAEELRKKTVSKDYLDNIIQSMAESLIVLNPDLTINSVNKATCSLLGYKEEELIGKPVENILSPEGAISEEIDLKNLIKDAKMISYEINYRGKDGNNVPVLFKATIMKDKNDNTLCIICTAADITKRKQIEEKLKEAMEMKSNFTSIVSHELRTPLAAIRTGINIILDELAGNITNEQRDFLSITRNNVDRLVRLINGILDFQRLDSGKMQLNFIKTDVNEVVKEIYLTMRSLTDRKGLKFTLQLEDNLPQINLDEDSITQLLTNLINNAIKFTEEGEIKIATQKADGCVCVKVSDTGIGISQENIQKLFAAFTRLREGKYKTIEGTGLGLAICKEIAQKHGGRIWVESEYGKGSTFCVTLPL
ncbi:MAG: ATP-binding protein [Candidatus Omnitrophica bacterium]|nr:ATP-binding protein [Candidatus Omnitrophota bacterium]